jgi:stringent starvation protein B
MPASSWIAHVKAVYAKGKSKGMSYKDALRAAAKTWKKGGGKAKKSKAAPAQEASDEAAAPAPKKRRRKRARPGVGPDEKNIN